MIKYDKSYLHFDGPYSLAADLERYKASKVEGKTHIADQLNEKSVMDIFEPEGVLRRMQDEVEKLSKMAAKASREYQFTLVCDAPREFFPVFARALYHRGIKVKKVDNLENPASMRLSWKRDNEHVNPLSNLLQADRKIGNRRFTDFAFKIKGLWENYWRLRNPL